MVAVVVDRAPPLTAWQVDVLRWAFGVDEGGAGVGEFEDRRLASVEQMREWRRAYPGEDVWVRRFPDVVFMLTLTEDDWALMMLPGSWQPEDDPAGVCARTFPKQPISLVVTVADEAIEEIRALAEVDAAVAELPEWEIEVATTITRVVKVRAGDFVDALSSALVAGDWRGADPSERKLAMRVISPPDGSWVLPEKGQPS